MSLLFNMLSRFVIAFLSRSMYPFISWLQSPSAVILEPKKSLSLFPLFPHLFAMKWWDQMPWSWMLTFKPVFSLPVSPSSSSSSLSAVRAVSLAYIRLLLFFPAMLIPACASSSPEFCMKYSAYKLNKQVTIYSLDVILSQFGTSLWFHVWF